MRSINFASRLTTLDGWQGISRRQVVLGSAAAALAVPLGGCGGAGLALFAPFISFTFVGVVDRKVVSISFSPSFENKPSGNFDANSQIFVRDPKNGAFNFSASFSGSFDGRDLRLTLVNAQAPLATGYTGVFSDDRTIVLTPTTAGPEAFTVRLDRLVPIESRFLPALTDNWTGTNENGTPWKLTLATDPASINPGESTVLLIGTETLGNGAAVPLSGYASVDYIELDIARVGPTVRLKGTLSPEAGGLKVGVEQVTDRITFVGGGSLRRAI